MAATSREDIVAVRGAVERLRRELGLRGVMRGEVVRTTIGDFKTHAPWTGQSVPGRVTAPAVGQRLYIRFDLAGLVVRGLRCRRVRPS